MTFVLVLVLAAAIAVAVGLVAYWLTVLALRTFDRLAPYWYVRYIVAGRKMPEPEPMTDEEWFPFVDALGWDRTGPRDRGLVKVWAEMTGAQEPYEWQRRIYDWQQSDPMSRTLADHYDGGYAYTFEPSGQPLQDALSWSETWGYPKVTAFADRYEWSTPMAWGKAWWDDMTGLTWRSDEPDGS